MSFSQYPQAENLAEFRKLVRARRRAIDPREAQSIAVLVCRRFLSFCRELRWTGLKVGVYRPLADELSLQSLEGDLPAAGAQLFYPRMQGGEIEFRRVGDPAATLWQAGPYGIQEPGPMSEVASPDQLDVIIVPGLAFGSSGERVGMGKGYYDRYLRNARKALRVALVFDVQLFSSLPQNEWDQPVDWVISEAREARTDRASGWLAGKGRVA